MSHILCAQFAVSSASTSGSSLSISHTVDAQRRRSALLVGLAFAAGALALSSAPAMAGCNSGNSASSALLTSVTCQANGGSNSDSTAVGASADSTGFAATALGNNAIASGGDSVAIGTFARAPGLNATAVGRGAGDATVVVGATNIGSRSGLNGKGFYSTAVGGGAGANSSANAPGQYSVAIGGGDGAIFTPSVGPAINLNGAFANGFISTAVGAASQATGGGSSAFGLASKATADNSSAYGEFSTASGDSSIAIGLYSIASGVSSIAIGESAKATKARAVAIGNGSIANVNDTVSVGSNTRQRRIVNVAPAINPTDAVNFAQAQALAAATAHRAVVSAQSDGDSNLRQEVAALRVLVNNLEALLERQQKRIAQLER